MVSTLITMMKSLSRRKKPRHRKARAKKRRHFESGTLCFLNGLKWPLHNSATRGTRHLSEAIAKTCNLQVRSTISSCMCRCFIQFNFFTLYLFTRHIFSLYKFTLNPFVLCHIVPLIAIYVTFRQVL